ncbi:unnamed protein product [Fusarium graminearum]|uniref:Large ribosomal subunit protein P1 n=1 Tax=Gibberella zeae TaxID=5518 RepID=A0A4E9D272_GIBZA|nr:unnamed protein product [Fusarium graminearum]CAG1999014.1 unnamed protein product [Fusarium graminearum]
MICHYRTSSLSFVAVCIVLNHLFSCNSQFVVEIKALVQQLRNTALSFRDIAVHYKLAVHFHVIERVELLYNLPPARQNPFTMSHAELASSYAALILADDGIEITADKLQTLIKAANVEEVEPIWTSIFAKALEGKDVKDLLVNVGSGGGAAPAAGGAAAAGGAEEAAPEEAKEEGYGLRSLRLSGYAVTTVSLFFVLRLHGFGVSNQSIIKDGMRALYPAPWTELLLSYDAMTNALNGVSRRENWSIQRL